MCGTKPVAFGSSCAHTSWYLHSVRAPTREPREHPRSPTPHGCGAAPIKHSRPHDLRLQLLQLLQAFEHDGHEQVEQHIRDQHDKGHVENDRQRPVAAVGLRRACERPNRAQPCARWRTPEQRGGSIQQLCITVFQRSPARARSPPVRCVSPCARTKGHGHAGAPVARRNMSRNAARKLSKLAWSVMPPSSFTRPNSDTPATLRAVEHVSTTTAALASAHARTCR